MSLLSKLFRKKAQGWTWITPEELQSQMAKALRPRLVDVRGRDEFRAPDGHVPGAESKPMSELMANPAALLKEQRPIVLICLSQIRSSKAADVLAAAGVNSLSVVRGGMQAWKAAGLPLER